MRTIKTEHFSLADTIECGQTFSWIRDGNGYMNADIGQVVYVEQHGSTLHYETSVERVDLRKRFRLNDPLPLIQKEIARDEILKESIAFAPGLRLVSDDFFSCLISFILSIQSNIPRMHGCMQALREKYGTPYTFRGKTIYGFPTPEQLSRASESQLRALMLGWRAAFIAKATTSILSGDVDPKELSESTYEEAHRRLKSIHGVGDKVADCVCLFSLGFLEAFPIDVWIERVIQEHYDMFATSGNSYARKSEAARKYFGRYAGYAQEYLYNYARLKDGRPTK
ncbi:MAG: DNA-3-methyladenine glycosylase family protein [Candidatus Thorarchaeota archaeon]|jgi:N-glycosylase/DNA lyase